jgi:hypothetical protein
MVFYVSIRGMDTHGSNKRAIVNGCVCVCVWGWGGGGV